MGKLILYKPHPKQLEIHKAIDGDGKYFIVSIGRQFGKTTFGENQAIKWAVNNNRWKVGWISPTYKQCKKVFKDLTRALGNCPLYAKKPNQSDLILYFKNGSELIFYSAEAYDTIRGETFDAVVGDEVAFWKREAWTEVIKATLLVRGKKALLLSTPKGKNLFYELANQSNVDKQYHTFKGTSYDNPYIDVSEIEDAKRTLPDHIFRQEYLAEFLDDASSVFRNIKEAIKKHTGSKYYAGVDLGRSNDYTVVTVTDEYNNEVACERWRHLEWTKIIDNVCTVLNKYKPDTLIEANGTQDAIIEQIKNRVTFDKDKIKPFVTTAKSKQPIIENLIVAFENKEIGIIGHEFQTHELEIFTYEYNQKTRNIKYSAPAGFHDDYVMSRAICFEAVRTLKQSGEYNLSFL